MKTLARIGAGLIFTSLLLVGLLFLGVFLGAVAPPQDGLLEVALGLFLVGAAFSAGTMLWLAAEKWTVKQQGQSLSMPGRPWPWKTLLMVICAMFSAMVVISLIMAAPAFFR